MNLPRWDDDMKFELLRLKSELKPENFRVLHHPMGLGTVTKKISPQSTKLVKVPHPSAAQTQARPVQRPRETQAPARVPAPRPRPRKSFTRLVFIHALDLAFVALTIGLGLLLASWVIDPKHVSENPQLLKKAIPLQFLTKNNAFALVAGLYGFFSLYWLFFKFVSGSTLGESFLDNFWTLQNPRERASAKDSGDS